ncbi:MAG: hypothetical protein AB2793_09755 [Candidatus Thiodiazotropha sp.]
MENKYSLDALSEFLDYTLNKGLLKPNTAKSRKQAALRILKILDESERQDLRNVDIDHTFERFSNLQGKDFKPDSLKVFRSRLKAALTDFFAYAENPSTFKPAGITRQINKTETKKISSQAKQRGQIPKSQKEEENKKELEGRSSTQPHNLAIPIPLREDVTVRVTNIPADLSKLEAERIAAIIKAYAVLDTQ